MLIYSHNTSAEADSPIKSNMTWKNEAFVRIKSEVNQIYQFENLQCTHWIRRWFDDFCTVFTMIRVVDADSVFIFVIFISIAIYADICEENDWIWFFLFRFIWKATLHRARNQWNESWNYSIDATFLHCSLISFSWMRYANSRREL